MAFQGSDNIAIDRGGVLYRALGTDILAYIQANVGTSEYEVANIAERNALTGLSTGDRVFVVDATGDATVTSGWAIYVYRAGGAWTKVAEAEGLDITIAGTNLGYTASATQGVVTSSTGDDVTLPAANGTNAGLMIPSQFNKLANIAITQPVDLDALETASHSAVTLSGTTNNNPLTLSGQVLGFSISQLTLAP